MTCHEDCNNEAADRVPDDEWRLVTRCMADVPKLTERDRVMIETAYRRGYSQGYEAAASDSFVTSIRALMPEFICDALHRWRYASHGGRFEEPPLLRTFAHQRKSERELCK